MDVGNSALRTQLNSILQQGLHDPTAEVFDNQLRVLDRLVNNQESVLYIDGTGKGKSETYFLAAKLLRQSNPRFGPVIVIEPLTALINDQMARARAFGLKAGSCNSTMEDIDRRNVLELVSRNSIDLLFLTPEMITTFAQHQNHTIRQCVVQLAPNYTPLPRHTWHTIPLLVIDEIHYVSDVGHDFRRSYREVWSLVADHHWYQNARKLGLTATYSVRVENDLRSVLNFTSVVKGGLFRENLAIRVIEARNSHVKEVWISDLLRIQLDRHVLIFCLSRSECEKLAATLKTKTGRTAIEYYHAKRPGGPQVLLKFVTGEIQVLVATFQSIGAGFNKKDIHDVIWTFTPSCMSDFYQGIGRAGRDSSIAAKGYLLTTPPYRSDLLLNDVMRIGNILKTSKDCSASVDEVNERLKLQISGVDALPRSKAAVENGCERRLFTKVVDKQGKEVITLSATNLAAVGTYLQSRQNEVEDMKKFTYGNNWSCCWRALLTGLNPSELAEGWLCKGCSFKDCSPGGDIPIDLSVASEVCYESTIEGVSVYALAEGRDQPNINTFVIRDICEFFMPCICDQPSDWAISFIPDSHGGNEKIAKSVAEVLNSQPMIPFISVFPHLAHLKMFQAKTEAEKEMVLTKYMYSANKLLGIKKLLIYDDCINTGKTLMHAVNAVRMSFPDMEIRAVVGKIYGRSGRNIIKRALNVNELVQATVGFEISTKVVV